MTQTAWLLDMLHDFFNLLFPNYCLTCAKVLTLGEAWLCTDCLYGLPQTAYHQEPDNLVARMLSGRLPVRYAMALYKFRKSGKVQRLIHHLKYKDKPVLGKVLGKQYGEILRTTHLRHAFDLIVPVPLHSSRRWQRGYNQSDFFAQGLAESLNIPWSSQHLKRTQKTNTQTKKSKLARFKSVENAFCVKNAAAIRHRRLLLVDDIITTGATLEACGKALLAAGIQELSVATIAVVA
ncbi:MAG: ComF family protein [Bacteroidota bacterium]